ncbi:MAG TPA: DUF2950 domain-containing protein [Candidatus Binataceae bacterium]|nr:DUF2950 domain-containing protein [Candidatus Binataceae bacterium]
MTIRTLTRKVIELAVILTILSTCSYAVSFAASEDSQQQVFRSPASAAAALVGAAMADDMKSLTAILGPDADEIITSGDPVADNNAREDFTKRYDQMHRLAYDDKGRVILYVGADNWPLPIPIVKHGDGWVFDSAAGKDEMLFRRIGRNELSTIDVLQELADAQLEYAGAERAAPGQAQFAQTIFSSPGKKNGLYWPTNEGEAESPIGPLIAEATAEGYQRDPSGRPAPFHGYYYKVLTGQGADAPGGPQDYIVDGKMTRGFAFLAYPADYRASGVMTFMIDQAGVVVEKDLGPDTEKTAPTISTFNPDASWFELEDEE